MGKTSSRPYSPSPTVVVICCSAAAISVFLLHRRRKAKGVSILTEGGEPLHQNIQFLELRPGARVSVQGAGSKDVDGIYTYRRVGDEPNHFLKEDCFYYIAWQDVEGYPPGWYIMDCDGDYGMYISQAANHLNADIREMSLPLGGWESYDGSHSFPGVFPAPALQDLNEPAWKPECVVLEREPDMGRHVSVIIHSMSGNTINLDAMPSRSIQWVQDAVFAHWGIPCFEQVLVAGTDVCHRSDNLDSVMQRLHAKSDATMPGETASLTLTCTRLPPFHFDPDFSHQKLCITENGSKIEYGGQGQCEYQAAFLSGVLDRKVSYSVHFRVSPSDDWDHDHPEGIGFSEIYIGIAPDAIRNWCMLEGAFISPLGLYIDGFHAEGWILDPVASEKLFVAPVADFLAFVDMASDVVKFQTLEGETVIEMNIDLNSIPVRLCATLGYRGQSVTIVY